MAQESMAVDLVGFRPAENASGKVADQALTVDATAGGVQLTAFDRKWVTHVHMSLEAGQVRYTLDNSAPTTTNGHILNISEVMTWPVALANAAKFIRTGGTSGVIHASPLVITGHYR